MSAELHLPDLPEVPISIGDAGAPRRAPTPWHLRLRDAVSSYLPLLLMALLALGTWWLVKHTPVAPLPSTPEVPRSDPDYTMTAFAIERFDKTGRARVRVDGQRLRHYPDTDRFEIDEVRIHALSPNGQVTQAHARRALANGDISEVQLLGGAQVHSTLAEGAPLEMRSEFLHAFLVDERIRTHLPVQVVQGGNLLQAAGLEYDHGQRRLDLKGPTRALLQPLPAPAPARKP